MDPLTFDDRRNLPEKILLRLAAMESAADRLTAERDALKAQAETLERQIQLAIKLHGVERDALKAANGELASTIERLCNAVEWPTPAANKIAITNEARAALAKHRATESPTIPNP